MDGNPYTDSNGKHHYHNCRCIVCLKFSAVCTRCGREFTTFPSYRRDVKRHEKQDSLEKLRNRPQQTKLRRKGVIVPTAGGFLEKVVTDKDGYAAYNLGVISRFAAEVNAMRKTNKRFTPAHKGVLSVLKRGEVPFAIFNTQVVARQAVSIYELALATNSYPGDVVALLISYGLEHLAKELRSSGSAPRALSPDIQTNVVKLKDTPHNEFLRKNFPEAAPIEKGIEVVEYRSPKRNSSIPSAFED